MTVIEALELLEDCYVGQDIEKLQPRDRLNFWISLKEFQQPKIQRTMFESGNDEDVEIIITYDDK